VANKQAVVLWSSMWLISGAIGVSGCSGRPPTDALSQAELAVQQANQSKAPEYAPLDLRLAREQLDSAKRALSTKEYERARRLAEQALVQAQLAEAKAGSESARRVAAELARSIEALRHEVGQRPTDN
jgi:hypothetical protein